ncbi:MAG: trypsin-like serine peptidase [Panacagrimonas sp.]
MAHNFRSLLPLILCLAATAGAAPLLASGQEEVPVHVLPASDVDTTRADAHSDRERGPALLALTVPVSLGMKDGSWNQSGATATWKMRIQSPGATLLIAHFDEFDLPEGAELRLRDPAGAFVQGPFSRDDRSRKGGFWAPLVQGSELLIELSVAASSLDAVKLHLSGIGHGVLPFNRYGVPAKSGSCNVDVVCPAGNAWADEIRSAVLLQIPDGNPDGVTFCSGQLVNTTKQDGTPYVLTANHCGIGPANASNITIYFNYMTSTCGGTPNGTQFLRNQRGATEVFNDASSDHSLIRLDEAPPARFNAYLGGFDASRSAIPHSGVTIHHPEGDEKRISTFLTSAERLDNVCVSNFESDAFRVVWSQGVTEPGSSGGGLWNEDHKLVGVLSGGGSSCANPGEPDFFGRLDVAWDKGLKAFLDDDNTGRRSMCGANPGSTCVPAAEVVGAPDPAEDDGGCAGGGSGGGGSGGGALGGAGWLLLFGLGHWALRSSRRSTRCLVK